MFAAALLRWMMLENRCSFGPVLLRSDLLQHDMEVLQLHKHKGNARIEHNPSFS